MTYVKYENKNPIQFVSNLTTYINNEDSTDIKIEDSNSNTYTIQETVANLLLSVKKGQEQYNKLKKGYMKSSDMLKQYYL